MYHVTLINQEGAEINYMLDPRVPSNHITVMYGTEVVMSEGIVTPPPPTPPPTPPPPPPEPPEPREPPLQTFIVEAIHYHVIVYAESKRKSQQMGQLGYQQRVTILKTENNFGYFETPTLSGWVDLADWNVRRIWTAPAILHWVLQRLGRG